jgi:hypothetical protein
MGIVIGLESTAHTLSIGGVKESGELIPSCSALFRPEEGGIRSSFRKCVKNNYTVFGY